MAILSSIFQSYYQNILLDATITSTPSPSASYSLDTFAELNPQTRIRWGSGTVTIRWVLAGGAQRADIIAIPVHNIANGVASLTNTNGLNVALPSPSPLANGMPKTLVVDLTLLEPNPTTRTDDEISLIITANPANLRLGGAVAIYSPITRLVTRGFRWGNKFNKTGRMLEQENEYGSKYIQNLGTMGRDMEVTALATGADADLLEAWYDGNNGRGLPGLFWYDPSVQDAYFGHIQKQFSRENQYREVQSIKIQFEELIKGLPPLP